MNPQNEYAAHIGANLGEHDMAKLIMEKINEDQRKIMQKMKVWVIFFNDYEESIIKNMIYR